MFGCRTAIGVGCAALLAAALGCGGATEHNTDDPMPGGGTTSQPGGGAAGNATGGVNGVAGKPSAAGSAGKPLPNPTEPDPVDTACPMEELPPPTIQCDAFSASSCGAGLGCYPFVTHPGGSGCGAQQYGTACLPAGSGKQGDRCGDDTGDICASGYVCVVGQRAGKRCAALCRPGSEQCPGGLICSDLDVEGFGVCG